MRISFTLRQLQQALLVVAVSGILLASFFAGRGELRPLPPLAPAEWEYLSNQTWQRATTGWLMMGYEGLPALDSTFYYGEPLVLKDHPFAKGIGTYAPSEIVYKLDGSYTAFETMVGVIDDGLPGYAGARFLVYLDGVQAYQSLSLNKDSDPVLVRVPLARVEELRLLVERSSESVRGAHVTWADARIYRDPAGARAPLPALLRELISRITALRDDRATQARDLRSQAQAEISALQRTLGSRLPGASDTPELARDEAAGTVGLVNNKLEVLFSVDGPRYGTVTVLDLESQEYVLRQVSPQVQTEDGVIIDLREDTTPGPAEAVRVEAMVDPALGPGSRLRVPLVARHRDLELTLEFALFDDSPVLMYRIATESRDSGSRPATMRYLNGNDASLFLPEPAEYLLDFVRPRQGITYDDGVLRRDYVAWGKPVYFWNEKSRRGLLLAVVEETRLPPQFSVRTLPGSALTFVELSAPLQPPAGTSSFVTPWLYLEVTSQPTHQDTFARYRSYFEHHYPAPALPDWVRYQWLSWYVYYMDMNEDAIVRQIDLISEHFADLGPWHIIVDAGWYVAEGRPGAEWRRQDFDKFPHGLRWLVDYAHRKGVRIVLYFTAPYLNTHESVGNWLGLRGIIEEHPDWVLPLDGRDPQEDYVYNFQNPELQAYLRQVMRDYFVRYDVDGIKLDGLGSAGEAVLFSAEGGDFGVSRISLEQTLDAYRLVFEEATRYKSDVYIEAGWLSPTLANPYSHTFRYGDEEPLFSRPYPLPGFMEHVDYAAYQQGMLGQRANMGAIYGDPNESAVNRWWLEAGLALGTQVSLSFDLGILPPDTISSYRSMLAAYRPFQGTTRIDNRMEQHLFSTERDGLWYIGLLNREPGPRTIEVTAEALGLDPEDHFIAIDPDANTTYAGQGSFEVPLAPESFRLLVLRKDAGVLWSNASWEAISGNQYLQVRLSGPPTVSGQIYLYVSQLLTVYLDGLRLEPAISDIDIAAGYSYTESVGVLKVWYPPGGAHQLVIAQPSG